MYKIILTISISLLWLNLCSQTLDSIMELENVSINDTITIRAILKGKSQKSIEQPNGSSMITYLFFLPNDDSLVFNHIQLANDDIGLPFYCFPIMDSVFELFIVPVCYESIDSISGWYYYYYTERNDSLTCNSFKIKNISEKRSLKTFCDFFKRKKRFNYEIMEYIDINKRVFRIISKNCFSNRERTNE